jgi:hypothetical protein
VEVAVWQGVFIDHDPIEETTSSRNTEERIALLKFNERLSSRPQRPLNESDIMRLVDELEEIRGPYIAEHALTVARITELALFCAGNYADGCEFEAAGDLLVNPRLVNIYVRGKANPVKKNRHGSIRSQLAGLMGNDAPMDWLKRNTFPNIRKQALLPTLYEELNLSGILASNYLESITQRMCQISNTVAFLSAWQIDNAIELHRKFEISSSSTRAFFADNLCRFDLTVFHEIGKVIAGLPKMKNTCRFLRKGIFI